MSARFPVRLGSIAAMLVAAGMVLIVCYYIVFSAPSQAQAQRTFVIDGDLYRASDVFGSRRITNREDIQILFEERNSRFLIGRGFASTENDAHPDSGTALSLIPADGTSEQVVVFDSVVSDAFFDRSGRGIFYLTRRGEIHQYDSETRQNKVLAKEASRADISPDGKSLVYVKAPPNWGPADSFDGSPGIVVLDIASGVEKIVTKQQFDYAPYWTPDGNHIIFFNEGMWIVNVNGTERTQLTFPGDGTEAYGISDDPLWTSDGRYLLYHADYVVRLVEIDIPNKRVISVRLIGEGTAPQWLKEGETLSLIARDARANDPAVTVLDVSGNVLSGDESRGSGSRLIQELRRVPTRSNPPTSSEQYVPLETPILQMQQTESHPAANVRGEVPKEAQL